MESYLYSPYELAIIIQFHGMSNTDYIKLLKDVFHHDNLFLQPKYRNSERHFILSVMNELHCLSDDESYFSEQAMVEQDMKALGHPQVQHIPWCCTQVCLNGQIHSKSIYKQTDRSQKHICQYGSAGPVFTKCICHDIFSWKFV